MEMAMTAMQHRASCPPEYWLHSNFPYGMAHGRLPFNDISNGTQPIVDKERDITVCVTGEFYDYSDLKVALERRGARFKTQCDSELLLHVYTYLGRDGFSKLNGEFAAVIYDGRTMQVLLLRDRFGIKPLYYFHSHSQFCVASEAKGLLASGVSARWNQDALLSCLTLQYLAPTQSLFQSIFQVTPGHVVTLDLNTFTLKEDAYWSLDHHGSVTRNGASWPVVTQIRDAVAQAVMCRVPRSHTVACHLSGGIDSSIIATLLSQHVETPLSCFTLQFDDPRLDESGMVSDVIEHISGVSHVVPASTESMLYCFEDAIYHSEGLAINGHVAAKYLLNRAISEAGYQIVFTGEGSDEIFFGYQHFLADMGLGDLSSNSSLLGMHFPNSEPLHAPKFQSRLGGLPTFLQAKLAIGQRVSQFLDLGSQRGPISEEVDSLLCQYYPTSHLSNRVEQSRFLWMRLCLANYILRMLGDGLEMTFTIEGRLPFLDPNVWEVARQFPSHLHGEGLGKTLLRDAFSYVLPSTVLNRPKRPLLAPSFYDASGSQSRDFFMDMLSCSEALSLPFFSPSSLAQLRSQVLSTDDARFRKLEPALFLIISAICLNRRYHLS
jgi:asparagine synthase (glutamine-hydrolysing)